LLECQRDTVSAAQPTSDSGSVAFSQSTHRNDNL
jgi:hypothetical protein